MGKGWDTSIPLSLTSLQMNSFLPRCRIFFSDFKKKKAIMRIQFLNSHTRHGV